MLWGMYRTASVATRATPPSDANRGPILPRSQMPASRSARSRMTAEKRIEGTSRWTPKFAGTNVA
jgi:hypothetical protein